MSSSTKLHLKVTKKSRPNHGLTRRDVQTVATNLGQNDNVIGAEYALHQRSDTGNITLTLRQPLSDRTEVGALLGSAGCKFVTLQVLDSSTAINPPLAIAGV